MMSVISTSADLNLYAQAYTLFNGTAQAATDLRRIRGAIDGTAESQAAADANMPGNVAGLLASAVGNLSALRTEIERLSVLVEPQKATPISDQMMSQQYVRQAQNTALANR